MLLNIVQIVAAVLNAVLFVESVNTVLSCGLFFKVQYVNICKNKLLSLFENVLSLKQAISILVIDLLPSLLYGLWQPVSWLLITNIQED